MSDDSVLTLTGYEYSNENGSDINSMGVYYFNPVESTINKGSSYKKLPGSPTQKILHQAVITPDKKSVYIFGGLNYGYVNQTNTSIIQFDISSSTFINHNNFTFIGGTATMLP
jgi:hypothetical protein